MSETPEQDEQVNAYNPVIPEAVQPTVCLNLDQKHMLVQAWQQDGTNDFPILKCTFWLQA